MTIHWNAVAAAAAALVVGVLPVRAEWKSFENRIGPVRAEIGISDDHITIGDAIECRITIDAEPGVTLLTLPNLLAQPGSFSVIDYTPAEMKPIPGGGVRHQSWFKLDPTLSGSYTIPPMEIQFEVQGPSAGGRRITTPAVTIQVDGLVEGSATWNKLKDIRAAHSPGIRVHWGWVSLLAALLAACAYALFRQRPIRRRIEPTRPPDLIAEMEIDRLIRDQLLERGDIEPFVTRLSDIFRRYIENRFRLHAPERTTDEFFLELQSSPALTQEPKEDVIRFLRRADLVKFAAERIDSDQAMDLARAVRQFVHETTADAAKGRQARMVENAS